MKASIDAIVIPITAITNKCIDQCIFPDKLKIAHVLPLYNKGSQHDCNNYRPISILPTISKLFENYFSNQLQTFFKKNNILHPRQSRFKANHSCQTALLNLVNSWVHDIHEGKTIGAVFLDFQRAFDLVDHEIFLYKLMYTLYHFSNNALQWFKAYLTNRMQFVKLGSTTSAFEQ